MTDTDRPILSIWAHYDDDLIFGNPTIDDAILVGLPVTSVFLTRARRGCQQRQRNPSQGRWPTTWASEPLTMVAQLA